jgi:hypothetical protein
MALAVVLGAGLAAFYLIPAAYEVRWVNIGEVLAPGVRPQDNFLFTTIADAEHNRFNLLVSVIAAAEIVVLAAVIWFSRSWRQKQKNAWVLLAGWGGVAAIAMLSITNVLWQYLPKLRFVQLPWRFLLCLNAALALLLTMATRRWSMRSLACAALLAVVTIAGYRIQQPWWDTAADVEEMSDAISDGTGFEGTDEYVPAGADSDDLNKNQPQVADTGGHPRRTQNLHWGAVEKHFVVRSSAPGLLTLRLFNYPAWEVTVNGDRIKTETADVTGQMEIPVVAGSNEVNIHFGRTPDRTVGGSISLLCWAVFLMAWIKTKKKLDPDKA